MPKKKPQASGASFAVGLIIAVVAYFYIQRTDSSDAAITTATTAEASSTAKTTSAPSNDKEQATDLTDYHVGDDLRFAMPTTPKKMPEQLLVNDAYVSSFNRETLMPNWVAWCLTADHADGPVKRKGVKFTEDDRVASRYRVTTYDYMQSGYDRGHMCPAGDNKWSEAAMEQCFLMTNMCPQDHGLNIGDWNEMESQCRRWAKEHGKIYIVCGPILYRGQHSHIGQQHKVTVPEAFFKVVLCMSGKPKGIGFIYRNTDGNRPKGDYVNSIDQVERITGLDFFPSLPDNIEKRVEAEADLSEW